MQLLPDTRHSQVPASWPTLRRALGTWANGATVLRTAVCVPLGLASVLAPSRTLLLTAYAVYWLGDVADGQLARRLDQETRIGAVLDVVSDRACSSVLVCALAVQQPRLWPALAVYLVQFMVLDAVLSLSFLRWPVLSPNYFFCVDRTVWRWNWSPPAKALNTCGVVVAVLAGLLPLALVVAGAQLLLKLWSAWLVVGLAVPYPAPVPPAARAVRLVVPRPRRG
jgi:CDP-diacylglycerol--glycerol-3-phosphate 3-phosphatidyltransferase